MADFKQNGGMGVANAHQVQCSLGLILTGQQDPNQIIGKIKKAVDYEYGQLTKYNFPY